MKIDTLIEGARKSGFMHHANAITIRSTGGNRWTATLTDRDEATSGKTPQGCGDTPDQAIAEVASKVLEWARNRESRAEAEMRESQSIIAALNEAGKEKSDG